MSNLCNSFMLGVIFGLCLFMLKVSKENKALLTELAQPQEIVIELSPFDTLPIEIVPVGPDEGCEP